MSSNIFTFPSSCGKIDFYGSDINKLVIPCNHLINRIDEELSMFDENDEYYDSVLLQRHMEELEQYQNGVVTVDAFFPFTPVIHTPYTNLITKGVINYGSNIKKELI